jgi:multicomponent Na+:H+ antiporter subunit F
MTAVMICLAAGLALAAVRVVLGPSAADRIVALDILTLIGIAMAALTAVMTGRILFLDVALILALLSFIGTVAAGVYVERRPEP